MLLQGMPAPPPTASLQDLRKIPKADLHVHLEGTVGHKLLSELARKNHVPLSAPSKLGGREISPPKFEYLEAPFRSGSFRDFIPLYVKISECIHSAEDILTIVRHYAEQAAEEGVIAAEMYVTPATLVMLNIGEEELFTGLRESELCAWKDFNIHLRWIFDIVRNAPISGEVTLQYALRARKRGVSVSAIGVAGLETGYPAIRFRDVLERACAEDFDILIHAGETAGSESIWDAIHAGPPSRIGHGIAAIHDPGLIEELIRRDIVLEICPCSNEALGITLPGQHPIQLLADSGVPIVLASDDPGIFGRTLLDNYFMAFEQGLSPETLSALAQSSVSRAGSPSA